MTRGSRIQRNKRNGEHGRPIPVAGRGEKGRGRMGSLISSSLLGWILVSLLSMPALSSIAAGSDSISFDRAVTVVVPSGRHPLTRLSESRFNRVCASAIEKVLLDYDYFVVDPVAASDLESRKQAFELLESRKREERKVDRSTERTDETQAFSHADIIVRFTLRTSGPTGHRETKLTLAADAPAYCNSVGPVEVTSVRSGAESDLEQIARMATDAASELVCRLGEVGSSSFFMSDERIRIILRLPDELFYDERDTLIDGLIDFLESEADVAKPNIVTRSTIDFTLHGVKGIPPGTSWADGFERRLVQCLAAIQDAGGTKRQLTPEERVFSDRAVFFLIGEVKSR